MFFSMNADACDVAVHVRPAGSCMQPGQQIATRRIIQQKGQCLQHSHSNYWPTGPDDADGLTVCQNPPSLAEVCGCMHE